MIRRIVIAYAVFSSLWIFLSDLIVERIVSDPALMTQIQTIKGWIFILITTTIIAYLLHAEQRRLQRKNTAIVAGMDPELIAIQTADLRRQLRQARYEVAISYDTTIEGWARALELKDRETEGHTRRVIEWTLDLARKMGIRDGDLVDLKRGVLLHDIGKMAIPDEILLKPGPLTDEEWEVMKRHPVYAYELLSPIPYLQSAIDVPYAHHEHWDGSGYPRGLRGEAIPFPTRVFSVIDVWDALRNDRPYRQAWPEWQVLRYIGDHSGILFDPRVAKTFLEQFGLVNRETE